MCCGQPEDGPAEAEIVMSDEKQPEGRVALYAQIRGDQITVGQYGFASNTEACWVPESVAVEMAQDEDMRKRLGPAPLAVPAKDIQPDEPTQEQEQEAITAEAVDQDETQEQPRRRRK